MGNGLLFCFHKYKVENRVSQNKPLNLLHHCRGNEITTSVMIKKMEIIGLFQAKVKMKQRKTKKKSENNISVT